MRQEHYAELAELDNGYWWFDVRFRLAAALLARARPLRDMRLIVDWGCGTGGFLTYLHAVHGVGLDRLIGFEPSPLAQRILRERGLAYRAPDPGRTAAEQLPCPAEALSVLDVLEHVEDPVATLGGLRAAAAPSATLVVVVPAFPHLWTEWDERLGHRRRYARAELRAHITGAGWRVVGMRFLFATLYPAALLRRPILGARRLSSTEFPRVSPRTNALLKAWFRLESRLPFLPLGTSLAAVAENPAALEARPA
jgi:hypothetical protein